MRPLDRHAARARELGGRARMIDVCVREQYLAQARARLVEHAADAMQVAARIHHRRDARVLAHDDGAILLERRDRRDVDLERHDDVISSLHVGAA